MVSQSLRAHQSVSRKPTPSAMEAILLATISNPQKVSRAPISDEPRYPAGNVKALFPPSMWVTPPSLGSSEMALTLPPVSTHMMAWPNSWKAMTSICVKEKC